MHLAISESYILNISKDVENLEYDGLHFDKSNFQI